jgi:hypothetical protein
MPDDSLAEAGEHRERIRGLFGEQRARRKPVIEKGNGMKAIVRFGMAVVMTAALMFGFAATASADYIYDIEIHVRACGPDAVDLWEDCHGNPVAGYEISGYNLEAYYEECTTDADGNCYFSTTDGDSYSEINYEDDEFLAMVCSSDSDSVVFADYPYWDYEEEDVAVSVVCDLYVSDETVGNAGAGLPNTGAGVSGQGANLGLLLAGVVALGGLAAASRRAAVR